MGKIKLIGIQAKSSVFLSCGRRRVSNCCCLLLKVGELADSNAQQGREGGGTAGTLMSGPLSAPCSHFPSWLLGANTVCFSPSSFWLFGRAEKEPRWLSPIDPALTEPFYGWSYDAGYSWVASSDGRSAHSA